MGLLSKRKADAPNHESARLRDVASVEGCTCIGEAPARVPLRICGEVQQIRLVPHEYSNLFEVTIADGTGEAVLSFNGNRRIGGFGPGRRVVAEGVARQDGKRLRLLNPTYTLLA